MDDQKQPFNPLLALLAALAALFFVFPLIGLLTGAPWGRMTSVITSKSSLDALGFPSPPRWPCRIPSAARPIRRAR